MSETVYITGKITPVVLAGSADETAWGILKSRGKSKETYYNDSAEQLCDDFYKEFIVIDGVLYHLESTEMSDDEDIYNARENTDGSINFEVKFYNGGCSLSEAIEEAVGRLEAMKGSNNG
jgi:hypothetical protein